MYGQRKYLLYDNVICYVRNILLRFFCYASMLQFLD